MFSERVVRVQRITTVLIRQVGWLSGPRWGLMAGDRGLWRSRGSEMGRRRRLGGTGWSLRGWAAVGGPLGSVHNVLSGSSLICGQDGLDLYLFITDRKSP